MELTLFNSEGKQDYSIFKMFSPNDNDVFLNMSEKEIRDFLLLLERYRMFYRKKLDISDKITFGTEIECVNANIIKIAKKLDENTFCNGWKSKNDSSLPKGKEFVEIDGIKYVITSKEFITGVLNNNEWKDLYNGCYIISNNSMIDNSCGAHVHIGSQILGRKKQNWLDFFSLWSAYEDVAYRFSSGADNRLRSGGERYAVPVSDLWQSKLKRITTNLPFERLVNAFGDDKRNAVNLDHVDRFDVCGVRYGNTIEFRTFNGSYDPIIIQNNINFATHLMEYATKKDFDSITVFNRREELNEEMLWNNPYERVSLYNNIDLYKSIELADMIFSNNLDKINFLKQCIKSLECFNHQEVNVKNLIR